MGPIAVAETPRYVATAMRESDLPLNAQKHLELNRVLRVMDALSPIKLDGKPFFTSADRVRVFLYVATRGKCGMKEVEAKLVLAQSTASFIMQRLSDIGLFDLTDNPDNQKFKDVALTSRGERLAAALKDILIT